MRGFSDIVTDLSEGARQHQVWLAFAWDEIQNRYRRSVLGLAWIAVSHLFFVFAIALFFGGFSSLDGSDFVQHAAFGFAVYSLLIALIVDGCSVFVASSGWVKSASLPYAVYVFKGMARALFPFLIHMVVSILVVLAMGWKPTIDALLAIPAFALILIMGFAAHYVLGLLAARLRDVGHLIQAVSRVFFFTTPIMWVYDETAGFRRIVADLNPMTAYVEIFRDPLLGNPTDPRQWVLAVGWSIFAWGTLMVVGGRMRSKLPFWV